MRQVSHKMKYCRDILSLLRSIKNIALFTAAFASAIERLRVKLSYYCAFVLLLCHLKKTDNNVDIACGLDRRRGDGWSRGASGARATFLAQSRRLLSHVECTLHTLHTLCTTCALCMRGWRSRALQQPSTWQYAALSLLIRKPRSCDCDQSHKRWTGLSALALAWRATWSDALVTLLFDRRIVRV